MKSINWFSLIVMASAALFTWNAIADAAEPLKIHVIHNLNDKESARVELALDHLGYKVSKKDLFTEGKKALMITKVLPIEGQKASISLEILSLEPGSKIPRSVYQHTEPGNELDRVIEAFPKPTTFVTDFLTPAVAFLDP